jgi:tripartite-type tricarboxylate transporter receptor subunit TctC
MHPFEAYDWKSIVARLNIAANNALKDGNMIKQLQEEGSEPRDGTPEELAKYLRAEHARWGDIVRISGEKTE